MHDASHPPRFYEPGQYPTEQSVGYLLNKVLSSILSQADTRLAAYKLTYAQWIPLYKLFKQDGGALNASSAMQHLHTIFAGLAP